MRCGVYEEHGIGVRNHCGAEPPRDTEPAGLSQQSVGEIERQLRMTQPTVSKHLRALREGRFGGVHSRRTAPSVPLKARTVSGGGGTRLTLWTNIGHRFISMGAAGWHICFDVLDHLLSGTPVGRIAGPEAMKFAGWQRLNAEYAKQFGIETPNWPPQAAQK